MPSPLAADQTQTSALAPQGAPPAPPQRNFQDASKAMQLTPQEQHLYQMHLSNLYGPGGVDNPPTKEYPQGSRSTLYQMTMDIEGRTYVLPTVWNGKILPPAEAQQMAMQYGLEKFPSYANPDEAEARYQQMHDYMERDSAEYYRSRGH